MFKLRFLFLTIALTPYLVECVHEGDPSNEKWVVKFIIHETKKAVCTGSLFKIPGVMTTESNVTLGVAHCFCGKDSFIYSHSWQNPVSRIRAIIGNNNNDEIEIDAIYCHKDYVKAKKNTPDFALIRLKHQPFDLDLYEAKSILRTVPYEKLTDCAFYGHGSSDVLRYEKNKKGDLVPVYQWPDSLQTFKIKIVDEHIKVLQKLDCNFKLTDPAVCAIAREKETATVADGDSGGPLVCKYDERFYLVAILKGGTSDEDILHRKSENYFAAFLKTSDEAFDWIKKSVQIKAV